jgi:MoaA/NifB/PqqE/SkfB family radical SAM enzyme
MYKVEPRWDSHADSVHVEWNLGKRCNLDCTYCPAEIHDNFSPHTNIKVLKDAVDALAEIDKPVRLSFTGGEPCVHPNIEELLEHASQRLDWVTVTTNGTRKFKFYAELPVNYIVFSLHFEDEQWAKQVDTITLFAQMNEMKNNFDFHVNVMAHHKHMLKVKQAVDRFAGHNIKYAIRRIRWTKGDHDVFDDMRYDGKDLEWILKQNATAEPNVLVDGEMMHANDVIKQNLNKFKGWSCNAGIESLMINWDGEVHRATCRVGGSLGNIYDGSFEPPEKPIICTRNFCTCAADIPLTKELLQ